MIKQNIMYLTAPRFYGINNDYLHLPSYSNFSSLGELFNLNLSITTQKVDSMVTLELIQFDTENSIIKRDVIVDTVKEFTLAKDTSYIEIKTANKAANGNIYTQSERKSTKEINTSPYYQRTTTDENGFINLREAFLKLKLSKP